MKLDIRMTFVDITDLLSIRTCSFLNIWWSMVVYSGPSCSFNIHKGSEAAACQVSPIQTETHVLFVPDFDIRHIWHITSSLWQRNQVSQKQVSGPSSPMYSKLLM